ncbi:Dabb family protein [Sulfurimonas sp. HSL-1716]|uniref:Dabb family protein n=1 Tax=Hydrocurvibacter sulfurireducens TaxID=3131937 RepID=UPI0031F7F0D6
MIVHIVMFKFKDEDKYDNILTVKGMLEKLPSKIDVLKKMEVGIDFNHSERAYDMSLYSTFETKDDLALYATHPAHLEVLALIKEVVEKTKVVDYEK